MEEKRKPGRPFGTLKYDNINDLQKGIDKYFADCDPHVMYDDDGNIIYNKDGTPAMTPQKPYTMSGLAYALDVSRQTLINYKAIDFEDNNYLDAISRARQKVEQWTATALYNRDMARGAEFTLKNNHAWRDQQDINLGSDKALQVDIHIIE